MLEESRNKVESYIYRIKNKLEDDAETIAQVSTEEQREVVRKLAVDAEEWLYGDGYSADLATMEDKFAELSDPFERIMLRVDEMTARPAALEALKKKLSDVEQLMAKWATERPQVTEEERNSVLEKVEEVRKWIADNEDAQGKKKLHEDPAFLSAEAPKQTSGIESLVLKLSKKPKPKPPKSEKNETADAEENETDQTNASEAGDSTAKKASKEESPEASKGTADKASGGASAEAAEEEL